MRVSVVSVRRDDREGRHNYGAHATMHTNPTPPGGQLCFKLGLATTFAARERATGACREKPAQAPTGPCVGRLGPISCQPSPQQTKQTLLPRLRRLEVETAIGFHRGSRSSRMICPAALPTAAHTHNQQGWRQRRERGPHDTEPPHGWSVEVTGQGVE